MPVLSRAGALALPALLLFLATACDGGPVIPGGEPVPGAFHLVFSSPDGEGWIVPDSGGAVLPLPLAAMRDPTPSPDGAWIVFERVHTEGDSDLYLVRFDGTGLQRLTWSPGLDHQPSWSPDGTRIAFRSEREGRMGDIWVMNADGTGAANLTPDPLPGVTDERRPAWSPSGRYLAFASNAGGNMDLWLLDLVTGKRRRLTSGEAYDTEPAWSPDGVTLAFRRSEPGSSDLVLLDVVLGREQRLSRAGHERQPVWSPDGRRILYLASQGITTPAALHLLTLATGSVVQVHAGPADEPAWLIQRR